ncbi:hypothetical protein ATE90_1484 [Polaribacter sp. Hel1_33_96]|mgnify:CR=1 FL=1|uniref:sensor of ECF-type sigma factor n=1 Tax=Polaribacter sp. Hel1_33_96 TaxID=1336805 RepID=UPI000C6FDFC9|nr:sensor of ECF-type sigma factor [Polaribacter sp. Hel1_33_96]PKV65074.1 hypothetical protein ATE90_1484 [Polaribacter sp. Hel1_33_96]
MKNIIIFICISLFCILSLSAQIRKGSRDKIKMLKISYLTDRLKLTPDEAQKFWPVYNIHDKKKHELKVKLRSEIKKAIKENENINAVSENDAERLISLKLSTEKKIYELHENFITKIKKILSYKKIIQLELAEMEFGRKLLNRYRHKKGN